MDSKGELSIRTSDELVMLWDIDDLNRSLVSTIRDVLHKQHHWLLSDTKLERAEPRYQLEVFGFFIKYSDFDSFEWFYLKEFIESISWSLRNRFIHEKDFPRFIDFLSGKHTSKSVRKALFKSFNESIEKKGFYNPHSDLIICRSFNDPNIVCHFLTLQIREEMLKGIELTQCVRFFKWLQTQYSAASIVRSISHSVDYCGNFYTPTWVNTMRMVATLYHEYSYALDRFFQKVPMNAKRFHDELIRLQSHAVIKHEQNTLYFYNKNEMAMEMRLQNLTFVLVKEKLQLNEWGGLLHNCLYGFDWRIKTKQCYIVGAFKEGKLTYAIEFDGKSILQAYGKYNSTIPEEDYKVILEWVQFAKVIIKADKQTLEFLI